MLHPNLFLLLSAWLFVVGAVGVLIRRNPLVVFMCVELMLNAGNLALVTFARMHRNMEGQVFALVVIAIAASEVVVGLALMVAIYKSGRAMDIDEMKRAARMSVGVMVGLGLLAPLAGFFLNRFPGRENRALVQILGPGNDRGELRPLPRRRHHQRHRGD